MSVLTYILVSCLLLQQSKVLAGPVWNIIHDLIQWNLAGIPEVHEKSNWNFDPKLGEKRRAKFVRENGFLAKDLIERVGQGIDVEPPILISKEN